MIVKNPTGNDLEIQYNGFEYSLPGHGEVSLPTEVATYWQSKIHNFLILSEAKAAVVPAAPVKTVSEEPVVEAPVPEAPAKKTAKK